MLYSLSQFTGLQTKVYHSSINDWSLLTWEICLNIRSFQSKLFTEIWKYAILLRQYKQTSRIDSIMIKSSQIHLRYFNSSFRLRTIRWKYKQVMYNAKIIWELIMQEQLCILIGLFRTYMEETPVGWNEGFLERL